MYLVVKREIQIYLVSFLHGKFDFYSVLYAHIIAEMSIMQVHAPSPQYKDTKIPQNAEKTEHFQ